MTQASSTPHGESGRVENLAAWYVKDQLDFDRRLISFRFYSIRPYLQGPRMLELGPADGEMTRLLLPVFGTLVTVDGSRALLDTLPDEPGLVKVHSLFEEYRPAHPFDTVVMEHILEHVERPGDLLRAGASWLASGGRLIAGVPNGHSIHRLAAVKMGLLADPCELNARDHELGHRRVYTPETFRAEIENAGLAIEAFGGVFFKPLSNGQIQQYWTEEMIQGFYRLGQDFPENAAEIYAVCRAR